MVLGKCLWQFDNIHDGDSIKLFNNRLSSRKKIEIFGDKLFNFGKKFGMVVETLNEGSDVAME